MSFPPPYGLLNTTPTITQPNLAVFEGQSSAGCSASCFLHPNRAHDEAKRKRREKCFQEFGAIQFTFPPEGDRG
jgi:hypothetical protein